MLLSKLPPVLAKIVIFLTSARRHFFIPSWIEDTFRGADIKFEVLGETQYVEILTFTHMKCTMGQRSRRGNFFKKMYVSNQIYSEQWSTAVAKPI